MRDVITMSQERIDYLRGELEAERISTGELIEIQGEFEKIPESDLPEPAENAMASDMLDEIEARTVDTAQRLIHEVDVALSAALNYAAPPLIITKKGNAKCPWCRQRLGEDEIINLDCSIRWNRGGFEQDERGGNVHFSDGDTEHHTFGYMTECCMALVSLPEGVDESW
jgi:hypothetical protein